MRQITETVEIDQETVFSKLPMRQITVNIFYLLLLLKINRFNIVRLPMY